MFYFKISKIHCIITKVRSEMNVNKKKIKRIYYVNGEKMVNNVLYSMHLLGSLVIYERNNSRKILSL